MSAEKRGCGVNAAKIRFRVGRQTKIIPLHLYLYIIQKDDLSVPINRHALDGNAVRKNRRFLTALPTLAVPKENIRLEREFSLTAAP